MQNNSKDTECMTTSLSLQVVHKIIHDWQVTKTRIRPLSITRRLWKKGDSTLVEFQKNWYRS